MKERYSFLKTPLDNPFPRPSEGHKFENGSFNSGEKNILITSMTIHTDGIVVDSRTSTEDNDSFLEDGITWASKEYGLPSVNELPIKRVYASELNVAFDKQPSFFDKRLTSFLGDASSILGDKALGFAGFSLSTEQGIGVQAQVFKFEIEINTGFDENRYYSYAPTTTSKHFKLLEMLEKAST